MIHHKSRPPNSYAAVAVIDPPKKVRVFQRASAAPAQLSRPTSDPRGDRGTYGGRQVVPDERPVPVRYIVFGSNRAKY